MWRVGNASGETPIVVTDRDGAELRERDALSEAEMLYASLRGKVSILNARVLSAISVCAMLDHMITVCLVRFQLPGGNATKRVLTTFSSTREVVLYHRIAKTASTTLVNLIEQLSQTNGFYVLELQHLLQDTELWRLTPAMAVPKDRCNCCTRYQLQHTHPLLRSVTPAQLYPCSPCASTTPESTAIRPCIRCSIVGLSWPWWHTRRSARNKFIFAAAGIYSLVTDQVS